MGNTKDRWSKWSIQLEKSFALEDRGWSRIVCKNAQTLRSMGFKEGRIRSAIKSVIIEGHLPEDFLGETLRKLGIH